MTTPVLKPPSYAVAGVLLEAVAAQDFAGLAAAFADDARMSALTPRGCIEREGPQQISAAFAGWFGDADGFELVDAGVGAVGSRLALHWRVRVRAARYGEQWVLIEQHAYAESGDDGLISAMRLVCSGRSGE